MQFSKMHGAGNDFLLVDVRSEPARDWSQLAVKMCDRHFGAGADGLILVDGDKQAGFAMTIYNPDGSEAEMCGNGIRCFARFLHQRGEIGSDRVTVSTGAGPRWIQIVESSEREHRAAVGMGVPDFTPRNVPADLPGDRALDYPIDVDGVTIRVTAVSVGNPHAVTFVDHISDFELERIGPLMEHHRLFPRRVNFEVCQVLGPGRLRLRVWERGAGITLACGTGAAAAVAAAVITGRVEAGPVDLQADGGFLKMDWKGEGHEVVMVGPAQTVFEGRWVQEAPVVAGAARLQRA